MIKIKGTPTQEEAEKLFSDWKQERDVWNEKAKKHDRILNISITIVCIALSIVILWLNNWGNNIVGFIGGLSIAGLVCVPFAGVFMSVLFGRGEWEYNECSWPIKYKYYHAIKDKNVLDSKLNDNMLELIVENKNHEVKSAFVAGFSKKTRTDVDEVVVDLDAAEILIPYKN